LGSPRIPTEAALFAGIIRADEIAPSRVENALEREFGRIILRSETYPFTESDYYDEEMGSPIWRSYLAFDRTIPMDGIAEIKRVSNKIEGEVFSRDGKRSVNIDPGYLTLGKVVLATTKDFGHRVYLREGIYAEITLRYSAGVKGFVPWEWTYRDYRREAALRFFNELRALYRGGIPGPGSHFLAP
jgi:hypothetical protein